MLLRRKTAWLVLLLLAGIGLLAGCGAANAPVGDAARALVERLDKTNIVTLVRKLIGKNVMVDGMVMQGQNDFEFHFAGKYKQLAEVIAFVLEVNYSDFLDELKRIILSLQINLDQKDLQTGETNSDNIPEKSDQSSKPRKPLRGNG